MVARVAALKPVGHSPGLNGLAEASQLISGKLALEYSHALEVHEVFTGVGHRGGRGEEVMLHYRPRLFDLTEIVSVGLIAGLIDEPAPHIRSEASPD